MKALPTPTQATPLAVFIEALVFLSETVGGYKDDAEEVAFELIDSLLADDRKSQEEGIRKLRRLLLQAEGLDNFVDYVEETDNTAPTTEEDEGYFISPSEETNRPVTPLSPTAKALMEEIAQAAGLKIVDLSKLSASAPSVATTQMYRTPFGIFTGQELGIH